MAVWRKIWIKAKDNAVVRRRGAEALGILCWLLLSADEQGVVRCSVTDAAARLCISPRILKKIVDEFAEDGTLEVESAKKQGTCIKLLKWSKYARKDAPEIQTDGGEVNKKEIIGKLSVNYKSMNANELQKNREIIGKLSVNKTVNKTGETDTHNSRNSSKLATTEKGPSRARLEEEDIYKYYTTPYARAREENPVERLEKEDREEAAMLSETIHYPTQWEEVRDAAVAYAISMDEEEADGFLAKYASVGWVKAGAKIRDWRYLLQSWHRNWQQVEKDKKKKTQGRTQNARARSEFGQADFGGNYGPPTEYADF